jgi:uncharacterized membrane protein
VIDFTSFVDLSQGFMEWVENWYSDYRVRQTKKAGKVIDLPDTSRFFELDAARGLAILMMIIKHFLDGWGRALIPNLSNSLLLAWAPLKVLFIAGISAYFFSSALLESALFHKTLESQATQLPFAVKRGLAWALAAVPALLFGLHGVGAAAFLVLSGLTMAVRTRRQDDPQKLRLELLRQGFVLLGLGLFVTALSLLMVPKTPIYFGILHLIGLANLLALPFLALPVTVIAVCGLAISAAGALIPFNLPWWLGLGFVPVSMTFADYTPLVPFFGILLLGLVAGRNLYPDGYTRKYSLPDLSRYPIIRALAALGRHSLLVYLAQEPFYLAGIAGVGA